MLLAFWIFQSTRPHGGATALFHGAEQSSAISIHAPAWGRDSAHFFRSSASCRFQSTRPHGGATHGICRRRFRRWDFNPRARMGARLSLAQAEQVIGKFQSTRPHGGATPRTSGERRLRAFQSTRPHGGATFIAIVIIIIEAISIHAPAWGRDRDFRADTINTGISIHAPAWGRDRTGAGGYGGGRGFQSTRPHGGATPEPEPEVEDTPISIHAPAWGRDDGHWRRTRPCAISIHAPAWGRDPGSPSGRARSQISIHAPAWGRDRDFIHS